MTCQSNETIRFKQVAPVDWFVCHSKTASPASGAGALRRWTERSLERLATRTARRAACSSWCEIPTPPATSSTPATTGSSSERPTAMSRIRSGSSSDAGPAVVACADGPRRTSATFRARFPTASQCARQLGSGSSYRLCADPSQVAHTRPGGSDHGDLRRPGGSPSATSSSAELTTRSGFGCRRRGRPATDRGPRLATARGPGCPPDLAAKEVDC